MKSSQIARALYGPSLFEVTIGAWLSVILGAFLGFAFLVLKPAIVVKELPKEEDRVQDAIYFKEGTTDAVRGRQWMKKRQLLLDGTPGEITFSEEELNAWLSSGAPKKEKKPAPRPVTPAKPGSPPPAPETPIPSELLTLDAPNVRIRDSVFQIGFPGSLNLVTFSLPVIVQAQGDFEKMDEVWVFKPTSLYMGSMPLHRIPGLTDLLVKRITTSVLAQEDTASIWKKISQVVVDGRVLRVTLQ